MNEHIVKKEKKMTELGDTQSQHVDEVAAVLVSLEFKKRTTQHKGFKEISERYLQGHAVAYV